jgi:hypothetical protein
MMKFLLFVARSKVGCSAAYPIQDCDNGRCILSSNFFCGSIFGPEKVASLTPDSMKFPVPDLAVEVLSSSTEDRDRGVKFEDFAINGVGEYWIIDAVTQTVEQYVLVDAEYELRVKSSSGRLCSFMIAGLEFEIEAMFDEQKSLSALRKLYSARPGLRDLLLSELQGASRGLCIRLVPAASALPLTKPQF